MKILIIEDERELAKSIVQYLRQESYSCEVAYTYSEGEEKVMMHDYDCILLDVTLPDGNGLKLLEKLKSEKNAEPAKMPSPFIIFSPALRLNFIPSFANENTGTAVSTSGKSLAINSASIPCVAS